MALATHGTTPERTMIAINDNYADGRDVSWLYDVSFESLREGGRRAHLGRGPTTWGPAFCGMTMSPSPPSSPDLEAGP